MQPDITTDNLYHNDGQYKYIRVNGIYYKWEIGKGWFSLPADKVPINLAWGKLPSKMLAVFEPELPK